MILFRYLIQEVLHYFIVIFMMLAISFAINYLCIYLSAASNGNLQIDAILHILNYLMPNMMVLLFPIALFMGIFIAYSRLFNTNELWVMFACGLSWRQLLIYSLTPALLLTIASLILSFYVVPLSITNLKNLTQTATAKSLSLMQPGQFYTLGTNQVAYMTLNPQKNNPDNQSFLIFKWGESDQPIVVTYAPESAIQARQSNTYLLLKDGWLNRFTLDQKAIQKSTFESALIPVAPKFSIMASHTNAMPTLQLLHTLNHADIIELRWRLTAGILPLIAVFFALPLCTRSPRAGRYHNIIPAILLFMGYCNLLSISRNLMLSQHMPMWLGFEWLNIIVIGVGLLVLWHFDGKSWFTSSDIRLKTC